MSLALPLQVPKMSFELFSAHDFSNGYIDFDGASTQCSVFDDKPQEGRHPYSGRSEAASTQASVGFPPIRGPWPLSHVMVKSHPKAYLPLFHSFHCTRSTSRNGTTGLGRDQS